MKINNLLIGILIVPMIAQGFSPQGILYIPFIAVILLFIHQRSKFYWVDDFLTKLDDIFNSTSKKIVLYGTAILLAILYSVLVSSVVFPASDVYAAMAGAIKAFFINGKNPYFDTVVPHILYTSSGPITINGTYNYGPIDLIIYGIFYFIFSPLVGNDWWIYVTNIIFSVITYFIMRATLEKEVPETVTLLSFLFIFSWFLQDNAVLMVLFLAIAWYVHVKSSSKYKNYIITIILTMGVLTKLYIAFVLVGYFVYIFKDDIKQWTINGLIGGITGLVIMFPFGIINVLKSIFLFHVDLQIRQEYATIQGGIPTYLELIGLKALYVPIAIILALAFLYVCQIYAKNQINLKFAVFTTLTLVLLPTSGYAFFIIPTFFLLTQYYINHSKIHSEEKVMS